MWGSLPLSCPLGTGPVSDFTQGTPKVVNQHCSSGKEHSSGSTAEDALIFRTGNMSMKKLSFLPAKRNETKQPLSSTTLCSKQYWGISSAYLTSVNWVLIMLQTLEVVSLLWFTKLLSLQTILGSLVFTKLTTFLVTVVVDAAAAATDVTDVII